MKSKNVRSIMIILVTVILGVGGFTFLKQSQIQHPKTAQVAASKKSSKKATVVKTKNLKKKPTKTAISQKVEKTVEEPDTVNETDIYSDSSSEDES